jgi:hypothetical protein
MERDAECISLATMKVLPVLGQPSAPRSVWASRQMDSAGAGGPATPVLAAIKIVLQSAEIYTGASSGKALSAGISVGTPAAYRSGDKIQNACTSKGIARRILKVCFSVPLIHCIEAQSLFQLRAGVNGMQIRVLHGGILG